MEGRADEVTMEATHVGMVERRKLQQNHGMRQKAQKKMQKMGENTL